jgi:hypothetical protein
MRHPVAVKLLLPAMLPVMLPAMVPAMVPAMAVMAVLLPVMVVGGLEAVFPRLLWHKAGKLHTASATTPTAVVF